MNSREEKTFAADLSHLDEILAWVQKEVRSTRLSRSEKMQVEVAIEEAVVNIIKHGAKEKTVTITLSCQHMAEEEILFELRDSGPIFNPLAQKLPLKESIPLEDVEEGGAGLILIQKCMDLVSYHREENQNVLTLVKKISQ